MKISVNIKKEIIMLKRVFFTTFVFLLFTKIFAYSLEDMQRLLADKKKNYNTKLRPKINQSEPTLVYMSMELLTIQEFDEVQEKFSVGAFVNMGWHDDLLSWDPKDYGGMGIFPAEVGDFWRPPIILVNPYSDIDSIGKDWNILRYAADGMVFTSPGHIFEASCRVDVTYYPWDQQQCALAFNSWGYLANEVTLISVVPSVGIGFFYGHGTWDLAGTLAEHTVDESNSSIIYFGFILNRKPLFVLVNVILPIVFMSFLNMLVFWIPTESGERISYCLTVLLAIAVFLTLVGENLPKKSEPMCLLSFYLLCILVLSLLIVLATIINLGLYFRDENKPVPWCIANLAKCCKCKRRRKFKNNQDRYSEEDQEIFDISRESSKRHVSSYRNTRMYIPNGHFAPSYDSLNWKLKPHLNSDSHNNGSVSNKSSPRRKRTDSSEDYYYDTGENDKASWKDVSFAFDVIFFLLFVCLLITVTTVYFAVVLSNKP